jgi:hypothetical protein
VVEGAACRKEAVHQTEAIAHDIVQIRVFTGVVYGCCYILLALHVVVVIV